MRRRAEVAGLAGRELAFLLAVPGDGGREPLVKRGELEAAADGLAQEGGVERQLAGLTGHFDDIVVAGQPLDAIN